MRWAVVNEVAGQARATQEDTGRSWRRVKAVEASYPRTGDTRATSVAKQISGTRATSVANESKPKSASHGNTGAFSDKAKPAVTPICRITHGMAVGSEHRDCSIAQTPGRNHESDNASGTGQRCIDTYVLIHAKATTSRHSFRFRVCGSYLQGFGLHAIRPPTSPGGGYCRQGLHAAIHPGKNYGGTAADRDEASAVSH